MIHEKHLHLIANIWFIGGVLAPTPLRQAVCFVVGLFFVGFSFGLNAMREELS